MNVKSTMLESAIALIAPHYCYGCKKTGSLLCESCIYDIIHMPLNSCVFCNALTFSGVCASCRHRLTVEKGYMVSTRSGALEKLINGYKFERQKAAAKQCAQLLHSRVGALPENTIIVPIPTAATHIRQRGYDHMRLIAEQLAQRADLPCSLLLARQHSLTQVGATKQQRQRQAHSAFSAVRSLDSSKTYLLIDDVVTTGATLTAGIVALRAAGARKIIVAALARQTLDE